MNNSAKKTLQLLSIGVFCMFFFSFALVPLYDVFCEITGLNGKISQSEENSSYETETGRNLTVQFVSHNNEQMPWKFNPSEKVIKVTTGKYHNATFYVKNTTDKPMTAQAVPSVAPSNAAEYLKKLECFCFEQQFLNPGEEALLPVRFIFDDSLPSSINNVALSYTIFDITDRIDHEVSHISMGSK